MALPRFPRLEVLLGSRLDDLTERHLQQVVERASTAPVLEDSDLDFKEALYGVRDEDKRSLAADIAAFANTTGGVILLGVRESSGVAIQLAPVAFSDAEELRMRQIIASIVAPMPLIALRRVQSGESADQGVWLLAVPKSPHAPHAVRVSDGLRYYRRDGNRNRPLSESEVADAYRDRFRTAQAQLQRVHEVHEDGVSWLDMADSAWLTITLVPNVPATTPINERARTSADRWSRSYADGHRADAPFRHTPRAGVGIRRLTFRDSSERGKAKGAYGELHEDGAMFAATQVDWLIKSDQKRFELEDESIVLAALGLLRFSVECSMLRAGTHGDAVLFASLQALNVEGQFTVPMALGHRRRELWLEGPGSIDVFQAPTSQRTISLNALTTSIRERLAAVRLALNDLFQAFGAAEVLQIGNGGVLRSKYWLAHNLQSWPSKAQAETSELTLDEEMLQPR